jgi:taurine transport system substrate-binding protein
MANSKAKNIRVASALSAIVATIAAGSMLGFAGPAQAAAKQPATIRIGYQAIPNGDLVVKHTKALEKAFPKTKIVWTQFESGGDVNTAMIAGAIDIGIAGSSPVTRGLSAPLNIGYSVPWIHDVIGTAESLVVRSSLKVTKVGGLKGLKIATPFASTSHFSLLAALKLAGLKETDVTLVDLEPTDILAAWQRGDIDAAYVWSPTLDQLKTTGRVLTTSSAMAKAGFPTYDLAVVANSFKKAYPAAVQTWIKAEEVAVQLIKSNPAKAAAYIAPELGITASEVKSQLKGLVFLSASQQQAPTYLGTPAKPGQFANGLLKAATFLKAQGKIDAVPSLKSLRAGVDTKDLNAIFTE